MRPTELPGSAASSHNRSVLSYTTRRTWLSPPKPVCRGEYTVGLARVDGRLGRLTVLS
jgi:hypothetical protein